MDHRGQVDYFIVLQGAIKIYAYDEKTGEINEIISGEEKPQIVRMPGRYWHGFKNIVRQEHNRHVVRQLTIPLCRSR
jgi:dTDP-4-dehydrorhamnose 3,5-epimerase-like enzyme